PLSSFRQQELLTSMAMNRAWFLSNPVFLLKLKDDLCLECQPTYFNLAKAMYPLLADAYALNEMRYGLADGARIGTPGYSLEDTIQWAKSSFPPFSPTYQLAQRLESAMMTIPDSAFHKHWRL